MSALTPERPQPTIEGAHMRRETSFGAAIYDGIVDHGNGRSNHYVEVVPRTLGYLDSTVVIGGGYTSSEGHYSVVQRQLALAGEHSVFAGHSKHGHYEIGHNAEDIARTCSALALGGMKNIVLLGHSQGAPEVLEAHEIIRAEKLPAAVTDIVLAFPAEFIEDFPRELMRNAPKFLIELVLGLLRHPRQQLSFNLHATKNIVSDLRRTTKEGLYLLTHHTGGEKMNRLLAYQNRPRIHFVVGLFDGLIAGQAVIKFLQDKEHDTLTVLRSGHIDINTAPEVTDIIRSKVRSVAA